MKAIKCFCFVDSGGADLWGAESRSELSGDPQGPATMPPSMLSSSSTPASGSSSTSPLHLVATAPPISGWPCESTRVWPAKVPTLAVGPDVVGGE